MILQALQEELSSSWISRRVIGDMLTRNSAIGCTSWVVIYTLPIEFFPFTDFIKQQPAQSLADVSFNPNPKAVAPILS